MRVLFQGTLPKDPAYPAGNEDACAVDALRGRIAISDGASESYDSRTWSNILVRRFTRDTRLGSAWLSRAVAEFGSRVDRDLLSWSKQASFDRGSFATLLGVRELPGRQAIRIDCVGDTLAVLLDENEVVDTFAYVDAEEFRRPPKLLSTNGTLNSFISAPDFTAVTRRTWSLRRLRSPVLLCMTDGLAEWALRVSQQENDVWSNLASMRVQSDLDAVVQRERAAQNMRVDDVTLVTLDLAGPVPE